MRSHVDRYASDGAPGHDAVHANGQLAEATPLLNSRRSLQDALDSIRYIATHVVKENEVREVSVIDGFQGLSMM